ncbi:ribonucleoside-diphosphate reductase [Bacillus phage BCPG3]|nr:ribonucleoside-diphosphate reductase [Bacillus phage BCPG3]
MGVTIAEPVEGVLVNKQRIANQGIRKIEVTFTDKGDVQAVFVERDPKKCSWSEDLRLDAWKLI